jgi:hypothetical protein
MWKKNLDTKAGFTDIKTSDSKQAPGLDIHEMGGARMGHDPKLLYLITGISFTHAKMYICY